MVLSGLQADAVTNRCQAETITIKDVRYTIIDTPGFFDSKDPTEEVLEEICNCIIQCTRGIKAILIVFEAGRLTLEQCKTLELIEKFFGNDALRDYAIAVLSKPTRNQMDNLEEMKRIWNDKFINFIERLNDRWGISPNSDYLNSNHRVYLDRIKRLIALTPGVYESEQFLEVRQQYDAIMRQKKEEEELAKKEYEENLRDKGKAEADKIHEIRLKKIKKDYNGKLIACVVGTAAVSLVVFLAIMYPVAFTRIVSSAGSHVFRRIFFKFGI